MKTQLIIVNGILVKNGLVLVAKRSQSKKIAPGKYHLPGGHVEFGEKPSGAIVREFEEEFGLAVVVGRTFRAFSYVIDDTHTVGISYLLTTDSDLSTIEVNKDDNEEIVWVGQEDLEKYFDGKDHDFITLNAYFEEVGDV